MSKFTLQLGFWTAVILAFFGTAYQAILAVALKSGTLVTREPTSLEGVLAGIYTLLSTIGLLILIAGIVQYATPEKSVLAELGVVLHEPVYCRVCINRFAHLTIIRQSMLIVDTSGLDRFMPYGSRSVFFALEMLGWGVFLI
jgi:hypothetical protein